MQQAGAAAAGARPLRQVCLRAGAVWCLPQVAARTGHCASHTANIAVLRFGRWHGGRLYLGLMTPFPAHPPSQLFCSYTDSKRVLVPMIHGQALLPDLKITGESSAPSAAAA